MIKFITHDDDGTYVTKALENEVQLGLCTFTVSGFDMKFEAVSCKDDIIIEGLARAAMNFAANRNAYIAKIKSEHMCAAFKRLGFSGDNEPSVEIPEALTSGCSCSHEKPF